MIEKNRVMAEAYYQAMSDRDVSRIEKYLHPDVELISPLAMVTGKEAVLESIKRFMQFFLHLTVRTSFGSETQAMLAYNVTIPAGLMRAAVLMTFKDNLIASIDLFYDTKLVEEKKTEIFSK